MKTLLPEGYERVVWRDKKDLRHTKFVKYTTKLSKTFLKTLKFTKFEPLGEEWCDPDVLVYPVIRPGNILLMKDGKYILIGHTNANLGICDHCTDYSMKDIVKIAMISGIEDEK